MVAPDSRSVWLMYHDVTADGRNSRGEPDNYAVDAGRFHEHLDALAQGPRPVVTAGDWLAGNSQDSVVMTFDDGWAGTVHTALPAVLARGMRATLFVTRDLIGRPGFTDLESLARAADAGVELGVHGCTHRIFTTLDAGEIADELGGCREFLLRELGVDARIASAPGGAWRLEMVPIARAVGLDAVACSNPTINSPKSDPFRLGRVAIRSGTRAKDIDRYGELRIAREALRHGVFGVPRRLLGPRRYAATRRTGLALLRRASGLLPRGRP